MLWHTEQHHNAKELAINIIMSNCSTLNYTVHDAIFLDVC